VVINSGFDFSGLPYVYQVICLILVAMYCVNPGSILKAVCIGIRPFECIVADRDTHASILLRRNIEYNGWNGVGQICSQRKITHLFKLSSDCKMEKNPLICGRCLVSEMLQELREDFIPGSRNALIRATVRQFRAFEDQASRFF